MDDNRNVEFLHDIAEETKLFYESPVVYVVYSDYADTLFKVMCDFHDAIQQGERRLMMDILLDFHLQWLRIVREIEEFKKNLDIAWPKESMQRLVNYTCDCLKSRLRKFHRYIDSFRKILSEEEQANMQTEIEIIEEMHHETLYNLVEKGKCIESCQTDLEYRVRANTESDELLKWVDNITDAMAMKLGKYLPGDVPYIGVKLIKPLQQIVFELKTSDCPNAQKLVAYMKAQGSELSVLVRSFTNHSLEVSKIQCKLTILRDRIKHIAESDKKKKKSSEEFLFFQKRLEYLEKRLEAIERLKISMKNLQQFMAIATDEVPQDELCVCEDFFTLKIFNSILAPEMRERLVTELSNEWDTTIFGTVVEKSMISIFSANDIREEFTDELGTFYIDEYSRRIYKLPDDDERYQPNEQNELVRVSDDVDHIYYYDECGRYYLDNKTRQRVYKAHAEASEYMMDSSGVLLKVKEVRDGVTYYYDNYGRYYIDNDGKHIYQDADSLSKYENDGLGNLVRIRSHADMFEPCPGDVNVTEDFKYLKESVGKALRKCLGRVLLQQPSDPIKYLSVCLFKYRENIENHDKRLREKEELDVEREIAIAEEAAAAARAAKEEEIQASGASEASYDTNMVNYTGIPVDDL